MISFFLFSFLSFPARAVEPTLCHVTVSTTFPTIEAILVLANQQTIEPVGTKYEFQLPCKEAIGYATPVTTTTICKDEFVVGSPSKQILNCSSPTGQMQVEYRVLFIDGRPQYSGWN